MKILLVLLSLCLVLPAFADQTPLQTERKQDLRIQAMLARPFVKAQFVKTRKLKVLSRPFVTRGRILFQPEQGLVWYTTTPIEDILLIGPHGVQQLKKITDTPQKIDNPVVTSVANSFMTIFSLDLAKIRSQFELNAQPDKDGRHVYLLQARDPIIARAIGRILITGKDRVEQIYIEERSGDSTRVDLFNEQTDPAALDEADRRLMEML